MKVQVFVFTKDKNRVFVIFRNERKMEKVSRKVVRLNSIDHSGRTSWEVKANERRSEVKEKGVV